jgi:hypothetical protein
VIPVATWRARVGEIDPAPMAAAITARFRAALAS